MEISKVLICGSRSIEDDEKVYEILDDHLEDIDVLIHGGAVGVDAMAERWAKDKAIRTEVYRPDYSQYPNKVAPLRRNDKMIEESDGVIAIWDGESNGTKYVIDNTPVEKKLAFYNLGGTTLRDFME